MTKNAADYGLPAYFDMQAKLGHTKHLGGRQATDELVALCQIKNGQTVLNVGSGSGIAAAYLAETIGIKVVGVDILPEMVASAKAWAAKKATDQPALAELLEFREADACDLPFEDNTFDAAIAESVNTFIPDREAAMAEYMRVVKPGGYIGFSEAIWAKEPTEEIAAVISETTRQELKSPVVWESLFRDAGLVDIVVETHGIEVRAEARNQKGLLSIRDYMRILGRSIGVLFRDAEMRKLFKYAGSSPTQYFEYMGYGLFVGKKP